MQIYIQVLQIPTIGDTNSVEGKAEISGIAGDSSEAQLQLITFGNSLHSK